jgi:hypothetical protein
LGTTRALIGYKRTDFYIVKAGHVALVITRFCTRKGEKYISIIKDNYLEN